MAPNLCNRGVETQSKTERCAGRVAGGSCLVHARNDRFVCTMTLKLLLFNAAYYVIIATRNSGKFSTITKGKLWMWKGCSAVQCSVVQCSAIQHGVV